MSALATIAATLAWLALGCIVAAVLYLVSRWMGKVAVSDVNHRAGGCGPSKPNTAEKRTLAQGMSLTHPKDRP